MSVTGKETDQTLLEMRDNELIQIYKLRLILNEIKSLDCNNFSAPEREKIEESIEQLKINDYCLHSDGQDSNLLGIIFFIYFL